MMASPRTLLAAALLVAASTPARADGWLVLEAPAALVLSDAQSKVFRAGVMPAVGVYTDNGRAAIGLRLRAGVLRNGATPAGHLMDPGLGGLGTAGVALRLARGGLWVEAVAGGGLTGRDLVPAVEVGVGWELHAGSIDVGPSARYVRVVSRDPMAALGSADLMLVGIDVTLGRSHAPRRAAVVARVEPPPPPEPVAVPVERDPDRLVEREESCATDLDGCEIAHRVFVYSDRIVLEERVLFDLDRARVKAAGRQIIAAIGVVWRTHPDWRRITIEGHADVRGTDAYNLELSQRRAEHVRDALLELGFAPEQVDAKGYGRSRPLDAGTTEEAHQRNRRVEFVIDRERQIETVGAAP